MSRKTDEIKKSIGRLEEIQQKFCENVSPEGEGTLLCEQMKSEIQNLKLWISMLYKYNGTSKSNAKVAASRENGKKGGRPPKFVTDLKKQKNELEALLSDLHSQQISASIEEEEKLTLQAEKANLELDAVNQKLSELKNEK
ncbi:hypothetical protein MSI_05860 [Treponema sp. JC4]|uniref:hypothetical protein n=1 Tax=Treponema sp. JC4 TaxID=1124982 RepID=UPI00025B0BEC|nr:hypothetical protein [Treponema sp. JC4]EID85767.1 hypothetical protein MSI_05860 [Treponema sp. JC4]